MFEYETMSPIAGLSCPCGQTPGEICNRAGVAGSYTCGCQASGRIQAESECACTHIVDVRLVKTVHPVCICPGEQALYTISLRNCSSLPLQNVVVTDPQAVHMLQVGTIRVNGVEVPGNLQKGVVVPAIGPGGTAVVTFRATPKVGAPEVIENISYACYSIATGCGRETLQSRSNVATLSVQRPAIAITKEVDRCYVTPSEPVLTYTLWAENRGTARLCDVVVTDELPGRLDYVAGSTRINGGTPGNKNPAQGIHVGTLEAGERAKVEFCATLDCGLCDQIG